MEKDQENKILVYKNDLKNKKNKNLKLETILFDNSHIEKIFKEQDLDTLEYRLKESKEQKYLDLDLKHMELDKLPNLPDEIYNNVKHLFLGDNKLTSLDPNIIIKFKNLETLDINNNLLTDIPVLPESLTELCCSYNKIKKIRVYNNLKKLDCSHNEIEKIEKLPKLELLTCNNNLLTSIPKIDTLKRLICNNNKLLEIPKLINLEYLNCIKNKITFIHKLDNIEDLLISYNDINILPEDMNKMKYLEIINTNIDKVPYFPKLKELYSNIKQLKQISTKYKLINKRIHKSQLLILEFQT
jgi:Leucine-rich repeat (LRR) protein